MAARRQAMADRHPLVEDVTLALPQAFRFRHRLQIGEDPAFQMIDFIDALLFEKGGRFLAANPPGAEHRDFGLAPGAKQFLAPVAEPARKLPEAARRGIDRAFEAADRHFVIVAGVDHDGVRVGDQRVPVLRIDIGAGAALRIDPGLAHGNDLGFDAHLHPLERRCGSG